MVCGIDTIRKKNDNLLNRCSSTSSVCMQSSQSTQLLSSVTILQTVLITDQGNKSLPKCVIVFHFIFTT